MGLDWNYDKAPGFSDDLLKARALEALTFLHRRSPRELLLLIQDTRRLHRGYFQGLTPLEAPHFAGNYRGSNFAYLNNYDVSFGPGLSGCPARYVDPQMSAFAEQIEAKVASLDLMWADPSLAPAVRLYRLAELSAAAFVAFLGIHPYADGNGHMSRYIVTALFAMYGYRLRHMPIHPRPKPSPPLHELLTIYRAGNTTPLVKYLLSNLALITV